MQNKRIFGFALIISLGWFVVGFFPIEFILFCLPIQYLSRFDCLGTYINGISLATLVYFFSLVLIPVGFTLVGFLISKENRAKESLKFLGISLFTVLLVFGYSIGNFIFVGLPQIKASQKNAEAFQNQGYPIRVIDPTNNTVLNNTTIDARSPLSVTVNVLEDELPLGGAIVATVEMAGGGVIGTTTLAPTGQVINSRHYFLGTLVFTVPAGATQGYLRVRGSLHGAIGQVNLNFK